MLLLSTQCDLPCSAKGKKKKDCKPIMGWWEVGRSNLILGTAVSLKHSINQDKVGCAVQKDWENYININSTL